MDEPHHTQSNDDMSAWFLGPKAENADLEEALLLQIFRDYVHWRRNYHPSDTALVTQKMRRASEEWSDQLAQQISEMIALLKRHFPFYSPRYIGHQLSDQTLPSVLGYFAGMLYNPNNVTPEAAPVTVAWELEVGQDILGLLGYKLPPSPQGDPNKRRPEFGWAHITSGGTVANLEALWVARNVRFFPLAARSVAVSLGLDVEIKLPGLPAGETRQLATLTEHQCLSIKPNEAIYLLAKFVDAVRRRLDLGTMQAAATHAWDLLEHTGKSILHQGLAPILERHTPVIFVSGAAHYSIAKAADLLGIGRANVKQVDVDRHFRLDPRCLERAIRQAVRRGQYPLAVIGIAGTTEEGAVDPIHDICDLRQRLEQEIGCSFWLHIDSAWGGYVRSVFVPADMCRDERAATLDQRIMDVNRFVSRKIRLAHGQYQRDIQVQWGSKDVCSAFLAFPQAESITVDPHKMGYMPYPCGVVAYKNDRVRHFLAQKAPYITATTEANVHTQVHQPPDSVGPFILEGSKPGAVAASAWLAHRMIPPNQHGYGRIIRASLLAARELYERLLHWEAMVTGAPNRGETSYQFLPITTQPPDTNIVCFVVKEKHSRALATINDLGERVYRAFSIDPDGGDRAYSYGQPFFLSRTTIQAPAYSVASVRELLDRMNVDADDYLRSGIFVLRSTVMTPFITMASEQRRGQEYLAEFMEQLARTTKETIDRLPRGRFSDKE